MWWNSWRMSSTDELRSHPLISLGTWKRSWWRVHANNKPPACIPASVSKLYGGDINMSEPTIQLGMLPRFLKAWNIKVQSKSLQYGACVQYSAAHQSGQRMLSEVECLLPIYLTLPVTTDTAGRAFSVLRRLKTDLRGTVTQKRLNSRLLLLLCLHLLLLCLCLHLLLCLLLLLRLPVHKDRTNKLDLRTVGQDFVIANDRRR